LQRKTQYSQRFQCRTYKLSQGFSNNPRRKLIPHEKYARQAQLLGCVEVTQIKSPWTKYASRC